MKKDNTNLAHRIITSKILTVILAVVTLLLTINGVFSLTRIPILSIVTFITSGISVAVLVIAIVILIIDLLGWFTKRSKPRMVVVVMAIVSVCSSGIIVGRQAYLVKKDDLPINILQTAKIDMSTPKENVKINSYGKFNGRNYGLSIWQPKDNNKLHPVVLNIHGGGWISGNRYEDAPYCKYLSDHGYTTISIEYPLSTKNQHLWNQQETFIAKSLIWINKHAKQYGGNPKQLFITGQSAGGNLAINVATKANDGTFASKYKTAIPHVKAISAMIPAVNPQYLWNHTDPTLRPMLRDMALTHWNGSPSQYPHRYATNNSAQVINKNTPPILMVYGGSDHLVVPEGNKPFLNKIKNLKLKAKIVAIPYADHTFGLGNGLNYQIFEALSDRWFNRNNH
ncbi:alpha/beta hydrolase [uncultured Limosilactobacillus sp.]|uniref:alpha/beta hydrolase n=1 Tax=uncultured Limosilactobacillus sp. TaxID=2837629 RepID=UPI0025E11027|nr:alpha/beta hydrolase [uncultured Limosilactobacillus sp.]